MNVCLSINDKMKKKKLKHEQENAQNILNVCKNRIVRTISTKYLVCKEITRKNKIFFWMVIEMTSLRYS